MIFQLYNATNQDLVNTVIVATVGPLLPGLAKQGLSTQKRSFLSLQSYLFKWTILMLGITPKFLEVGKTRQG